MLPEEAISAAGRQSPRAARGCAALAAACAVGERLPAIYLENANVLGARALRATSLVVGDLLAFAKVLEPSALDGGHVEEEVAPRVVRDETEALIIQSLDRTLRHYRRSS
jgi:hypothetical protein